MSVPNPIPAANNPAAPQAANPEVLDSLNTDFDPFSFQRDESSLPAPVEPAPTIVPPVVDTVVQPAPAPAAPAAPAAPVAADPAAVASNALAEINARNEQIRQAAEADKQWTEGLSKYYGELDEEDRDSLPESTHKVITKQLVKLHKAVTQGLTQHMSGLAPQVFRSLYEQQRVVEKAENDFFEMFPQLNEKRAEANKVLVPLARALRSMPEMANVPSQEFMESLGIAACTRFKIDPTPKRTSTQQQPAPVLNPNDPNAQAVAAALAARQSQAAPNTQQPTVQSRGMGAGGGSQMPGSIPSNEENEWAGIVNELNSAGF